MIERKSDCARLLQELRCALAGLAPAGEGRTRADYVRGYRQALREADALLERHGAPRLQGRPSETLATIREDLLAAFDTARAIQQVNGSGRCPCCGAVGQESADPSAVDDGRIRHDPECFHVVAPSLLAELRRLSGDA